MTGSLPDGSSFALSQQISYAATHLGHAVDPQAVPLAPSRDGAHDWVSAMPLRLAAGDPDTAAHHATRLAGALGSIAPALGVDVLPRGLVGLRLDDPTLVTLSLALPRGWADVAPAPVAPAHRPSSRRSLQDPRYAAQLAHARLCRLAGQPPGAGLPPHDVLVRLVDAWRVRDRLMTDGRAHHLADWLAAYGASVLVWTREPRPRDLDPRVVVAARDALADGLRASGARPTERL
ncbi:hypothetical protein ACF3NS_08865 [Arsenicicoccus cauae]|uniref:hypothetical protein n=1 Tax=Arsenicicoccus cauae TaxID=2663847 RepID=UPI00370D5140